MYSFFTKKNALDVSCAGVFGIRGITEDFNGLCPALVYDRRRIQW